MADEIMKKETTYSVSGIVAIVFLLSLAGVNAIWLMVRWHGGTFIAFVFYAVLFFLCLRRRHFEAGVIAGIFGFGIHAYEFFVPGTTAFMGMDRIFFYANLILPVPLTVASYVASRKVSDGLAEVSDS